MVWDDWAAVRPKFLLLSLAFLMMTGAQATPIFAQCAESPAPSEALNSHTTDSSTQNAVSCDSTAFLPPGQNAETGPALATAVAAPYGDAFAGDSNTFCMGMGVRDATHCWANEVSLAESGVSLPVGANDASNGGFPGINLIDETFYHLMYNQVNPTATANPIQHLMIGTNAVYPKWKGALATASLNALYPELYDLAVWDTSLPSEKFFPADPNHVTTAGTWNQVYEFVGTILPSPGSGYSVGDNLTWSNGATAQVDAVASGGAIAYYHVTGWPHPFRGVSYSSTGGTGSGATFGLVTANKTNYVYQSTGAADTLSFHRIPTPAGCIFLSYQVWPDATNPYPYGAEPGATFSVFSDTGAKPLTDSLTGQTVFSSNLRDTEQPRELDLNLGTFFGFKTLKLCGLAATGTHYFTIKKISPGYLAIKVLIAPSQKPPAGAGAPNLNVIGILPIYPQFRNAYEGAIATYNGRYSNMVVDLEKNFGRHIVYTDDSSVDMADNYFGGKATAQTVTTCGIANGVVTFGASAATAIYAAGQVIWASNLGNCAAANGQLLVVGPSPTATSWTATAQSPASAAGQALAAATAAYGPDSGCTELTINGWIVNRNPPLHMPQNAQMELAGLVENADAALVGSFLTAAPAADSDPSLDPAN